MTEPLVIRRRPTPTHMRMLVTRVAILVAGLGLVVSSAVAFLTRPLDGNQEINAAGLFALGLFLTGLGGQRTWRARRLLSRPVTIRLDDEGVHLAAGAIQRPGQVHLAWGDVRSVMIGPAPAASVPGGVVEGHTLLRFIPVSDDVVVGVTDDVHTRRKAASLGMSTAEAGLALLQHRTSAFRVPLVLDWVRRYRPEVPVIDYRVDA